MTRLRLCLLALLALPGALPGCARRPLPGAPLEPLTLVGGPAAPSTVPDEPALPVEQALARALRDDPHLLALAAEARAVAAWPAREPLELAAGTDSDGRPELGASFDLLSVLGLGPVRAERVLARLRAHEAGLRLLARGREVAGEVLEDYAASAALARVPPPPSLLDPQAFVEAGLAPTAVTASAEAARAALPAEEAEREALRLAARLRVGRHLGLPPGAAPRLGAVPPGWPDVPAPEATRLLATSPEVQRRLGAYEAARGELLHAQSLRDPGLVLEPGLALDPVQLLGALRLRLPQGAEGPIRAGFARLEAARLEARAAVLIALEEAHAAAAALAAAEARAAAERARYEAALALAGSERARVLAQGEGFTEAVLAANAVVDAASTLRDAEVAAARARVRAALAAGAAPLP